MKSDCQKCGQPFEHPSGVSPQIKYKVCPACKQATARAAKQKWKHEHRSLEQDESWLKKLCVRSATEVGAAVGLSRDQVLIIERQAIRKLQAHKQMLAAARNEDVARIRYFDDPVEPMSPSPAELIDIQMSVGEWWAVADHCADTGKTMARQECVKQIATFQNLIGRFLNFYPVQSLGGGAEPRLGTLQTATIC